MKKNEFKKTLNLNKQKISSLNNSEMIKIKGGSLYESVEPQGEAPKGAKGAEKNGGGGKAKHIE